MSRDGFASVPDWYYREAVPALGLTPRETGIYVVLRGRANVEGVCWPSLDTIAYESGQSVRAVRTGIRALVAARLVQTLGRPNRNAEQRYRVGMKPPLPPLPSLVTEATKRLDRATRAAESAARNGDDPSGNIGTPERQDLHPRAAESAGEVDPEKYTNEEHPLRNSDLPVTAGAKPLSAGQTLLVTDAIAATVDDYWLEAVTADSTVTVAALTALELDLLTSLDVKARRARIADWCGLAASDGRAMENQDDRLLALLYSHGLELPDDDPEPAFDPEAWLRPLPA